MALTHNHLRTDEGTAAGGSVSITTGAFTPSNNSLLVVVWVPKHETSSDTITPTISDSAGLTWTLRDNGPLNLSNEYPVIFYTAPVTIGQSMTVTVTADNAFNTTDHEVHIEEFINYNTSDPVGQTESVSPSGRSGAYTLTLPGTTISQSIVLAVGVRDTGGAITFEAGWTAITSGTSTTGNQTWALAKQTGAMSTVEFDELSSSFRTSAAAIEIKSAYLNFPSSPGDRDIYRNNGLFFYDSTMGAWRKVTSSRAALISYGIDNDGTALATGQQGTIYVPENFEIIRWTMLADQSGSANIDMWSREYGTTLPTQGNTMTGNIGMTISSSTANQSNNIGNWTMKKINAGNVITYSVQACSTITRLTVNLFGTKE